MVPTGSGRRPKRVPKDKNDGASYTQRAVPAGGTGSRYPRQRALLRTIQLTLLTASIKNKGACRSLLEWPILCEHLLGLASAYDVQEAVISGKVRYR